MQTSSASKQHPPRRLITDSRLHYLWPQPRHIIPILVTKTDTGDIPDPCSEYSTSFSTSGEIILNVVHNAAFTKDLYDMCKNICANWTQYHNMNITVKHYNPLVSTIQTQSSDVSKPAEIFIEINDNLCTHTNGYKITVHEEQVRKS